MNKKISVARIQAYKALCEVIINKAFSNIAVNKHINLCVKSIEDRKLAINIVYGTLKKTCQLERVINMLSSKPSESLDASVKVILMMSLYQLMYLDKIPHYAVVCDAVEMCKVYKFKSAASFVNAVLRNALRKKDKLITKHSDFDEIMLYECNFPVWLTNLLKKDYSKNRLVSIAKAFEAPPCVYIRVNTLKITPDQLLKKLEDEGIAACNTYVPNTLKIMSGVNIFSSKAYKDGDFYAQDISGVIAGYVLSPEKNDNILDICAAPGGKSFNAAIISKTAKVLSCDINAVKLDMLKRSASQMGLSNISTLKRDAVSCFDDQKCFFDKVICDVPCSGLGVIARKPEILSNITKTHIDNLVCLQKNILLRACDYIKQGGIIVYSTCTLNKSENFGVIEKILKERSDVSLTAIKLDFELKTAHEEMKRGLLELYPDKDECDGFFIAKLTKNK